MVACEFQVSINRALKPNLRLQTQLNSAKLKSRDHVDKLATNLCDSNYDLCEKLASLCGIIASVAFLKHWLKKEI